MRAAGAVIDVSADLVQQRIVNAIPVASHHVMKLTRRRMGCVRAVDHVIFIAGRGRMQMMVDRELCEELLAIRVVIRGIDADQTERLDKSVGERGREVEVSDDVATVGIRVNGGQGSAFETTTQQNGDSARTG